MTDLTQERKLELWKEAYMNALNVSRLSLGGISEGGAYNMNQFCRLFANHFLKEYELVYRQLKREET